jgi:hypothetical protein
VREWFAGHGVTFVSEADFGELAKAFASMTDRSLRHAVRDAGLPLHAIVEGVRQESLDELARTLIALQSEYQETDNRDRRRRIRALVIEAKTHARFATRRKPEKQEMVEWMLVWLQDPDLFETWVNLRMRLLGDGGSQHVTGPNTDEADSD